MRENRRMADVEDTWTRRELPILRAALRRVDNGEELDLEHIRLDTGLPGFELRRGLQALQEAGYLEVYLASGWSDDHAGGLLSGVSERTRRELGSWPSAHTLVDDLVRALQQAADEEQEPERKSKLRAAADTVATIANQVAIRVIADRIGSI
jgi:hypothetical protein